MNAPALINISIPSLQMAEEELLRVLESSVYPGAKLDSIKLVVGYCKGQHLDPMLKPVHIVPMSVKKAGTKDQYEWRDVLMPGVGLYRINAARTEEYAGCTEPEFGPMQELKIGEFSMKYPEWCKVTVSRLVQGHVVNFTAKEYWLENYATAGRDSTVPNAMWKKRPIGQLAKCAEAQALRKAFPEVGAQPTAEEMEGKTVEALAIEGEVTGRTVENSKTDAKPPYPADKFEKNLPTWRELITSGKKTAEQIIATISSKATLTEEQKAQIIGKPQVDKETGETPSLLDDVKRICAAALAMTDRDTAFIRLDDARVLLPEMLAENKDLAVKEIDSAMNAIKARD